MDALAHPELLHLIPLLPAVVGLAMLLYARRRRQAAEALGEAGLVRRLSAADLTAAPNRRILMVTVAALMLGIALVGPLWGVEPQPGAAGQADVVLVLDASNSMLVRDVSPDRLAWEKRAVRDLLGRLDGDRVALTIFTGRGYMVSPLTTDFGALQLYLDGLSPTLVSQGGTSLADAIESSMALLQDTRGDRPSGSLVLLTDGDDLEGADDAIRAANDARRAGVPVSAIGFGTPQGGPIPDLDVATGRQVGWKHEPTGEIAVSKLGASLLGEIASRTGGVYVSGESAAGMARIATTVHSVPPSARRAQAGATPANRYEWFAALALLLLAADALLPEGPRRRRRAPAAEVAS
jgi:Ca-activated chloride channel family protein